MKQKPAPSKQKRLTDICPANRGQSTASLAFTSSFGISWLTDSMFPGKMAWWCGNMPAQWLPNGEKQSIVFIVFSGGQKKLLLETLLLLFGKGPIRNVATDMNLQEKRSSAACSTWDDLKGSVLFRRVIKSEPHRQNRATSNTPISVKNNYSSTKPEERKQNRHCFLQYVTLPHVLMPGHIRKFIIPIRF